MWYWYELIVVMIITRVLLLFIPRKYIDNINKAALKYFGIDHDDEQ